MDIIPLTLVISLCLTFTFIVFFAREQSRRRFSSTETESLLPLAEEQSQPAATAATRVIDFSQVKSRCKNHAACVHGDRCQHGHHHAKSDAVA
jgi:hypothetical protein